MKEFYFDLKQDPEPSESQGWKREAERLWKLSSPEPLQLGHLAGSSSGKKMSEECLLRHERARGPSEIELPNKQACCNLQIFSHQQKAKQSCRMQESWLLAAYSSNWIHVHHQPYQIFLEGTRLCFRQ